jgi:formylglycine-generating enzyme required for sulfatase activity
VLALRRAPHRRTAFWLAGLVVSLPACEWLAGIEGQRRFGGSNGADAGDGSGAADALASGGRRGSGGTAGEGGRTTSTPEASVGGNAGDDAGPSGGGTSAGGNRSSAGGREGGDAGGTDGGTAGSGGASSGGAPADGGDAGDGAAGEPAIVPPTLCEGGPCPVPPSCRGLERNCGKLHDMDCCDSPLVPGGTFDRSNKPEYPATVSDFRLDRFEITIGRFRKFVEAYDPGSHPEPGSGRNPNDPGDTGWQTAWDIRLPADRSALTESLFCAPSHLLWTDEPGDAELLPMNCLTWEVAQAFCIWDGGRLPTEAEWNYAAAGGSEQRIYPWSDPPASTAITGVNAVYGNMDCESGPCDVGSRSPRGDGRWGHADLAGNVFEMVLDWYATPYRRNPCVDCADLTQAEGRVIRGGAFRYSANYLKTADRHGMARASGDDAGARCARSPW